MAQIGGAAPPDHSNTLQASASSSGTQDSMIRIYYDSENYFEEIYASVHGENEILKYGNYTVIDSHDEIACYGTHGFQEPVKLRFDDEPDKKTIPLIPGTELRMLVEKMISDTEKSLVLDSYLGYIGGPYNDWD